MTAFCVLAACDTKIEMRRNADTRHVQPSALFALAALIKDDA